MRIRSLCYDDVGRLMEWDRDPAIQQLTGGTFATGDPAAWWVKLLRDRDRTVFAVMDDNRRLIGDVSLEHIAWRSREAELRIAIGDQVCWNQGYGTEACQEVLNFAFRQLNLELIYLRVDSRNTRAIRVYHKVGFKKIGLLSGNGRSPSKNPLLLMDVRPAGFYRVMAMAAVAASVSTTFS